MKFLHVLHEQMNSGDCVKRRPDTGDSKLSTRNFNFVSVSVLLRCLYVRLQAFVVQGAVNYE